MRHSSQTSNVRSDRAGLATRESSDGDDDWPRSTRASKASALAMASASQASDVSITRQTTPIVSGDNIRPHRATAAGRARNPDPMTRLKAMQHAAINETPSLRRLRWYSS